MSNFNFFEIRRRAPHRNVSVIIDDPSGVGAAGDIVVYRGTAIMRDDTNPTKGAPASPNVSGGVGQALLGFVTRNVVVGGPTVIQRAQLFGDTPLIKELELPFAAGQEASIEHADAYVAEGDAYIVGSGTGAITGSTPLGTRCSFKDGKTYVAQSGDDVLYVLADISTNANSLLVAGGDGPRCRFERVTTP